VLIGEGEADNRLETAPQRHRHYPCFDAAAAVEALLQRDLFQQIVDADLEFFLDHTIDQNLPETDMDPLDATRDFLVGAELVAVVSYR